MKRLFIFVSLFVACAHLSIWAQTTLKVLAIGNSFSEDAVEQYLYELGAANNIALVIGNMYIGGSSLETHYNNALNNNAVYSYRKIIAGQKTTTAGVSLPTAIADEAWDVITFQQVSQSSGIYIGYFPYLTDIKTYAALHAANPAVKFGLHMTWAYAQNATHSGFAHYHGSQLEMYDSIVATAPMVAAQAGIDLVIPSGTAIQNGRTTLIGDNFCRDGYHLETTYGRYTAACTWYEKLTGHSVVGNAFAPNAISEKQRDIAQYAAHHAVQTPYSVTDMSNEFGLLDDAGTYILQNPIDIDFGSATRPTPLPWNNLTATAKGSTLAQMVDRTNTETPVSLEITSAFGNPNVAGPNQEVTIDGWTIPADANYDSFWANAGAVFDGKQTPFPALKILNLNPSQAYDFRIFSSRKTAENRTIVVSATGLNTQKDSVNAGGTSSSTANTTRIAKLLNIVPKADGTIDIALSAGVNTQGNEKFFYLNAMQIAPAQGTGHSIPAPDDPLPLLIDNGEWQIGDNAIDAKVFDLLGRPMPTNRLKNGNLNIRTLPPGIYFLKIKNKTLKFLKR